ncbi:hypothetical protein MBLNU457_5106t1 [Dothideomycetes sp. NU457]
MAVAAHSPSTPPPPQPGASASEATVKLWKTTTLLYKHRIYRTAIDFSKTLVSGTIDTLIRSILTMNIGIMFTQIDELDQAERCFEEAAALKPELCIARFLLGTAAYKRKQFKKAEFAFRDCRLLFPKSRNSIDYGSLGLEYVLRLDSVIMNEVYSTWEWCQPQMAFPIQDLPPRPLHTLGNGLLFQPPRSLLGDQNGGYMSGDVRSLLKKDSEPTDQLGVIPILHSSKRHILTPSRSCSLDNASSSALVNPASATKNHGSVTKARSLNGLGNVVYTLADRGHAINATARGHPNNNGENLSLRIPASATRTQYSYDNDESSKQSKVAGILTTNPGADSHHCILRNPKSTTSEDVVQLRSRFSDSSGYKSLDNASITTRIRDRPRLIRQTLKRMASKAFTRSRTPIVLGSTSLNENTKSTPDFDCEAEMLDASSPTPGCEVDRSGNVLKSERRVGRNDRLVAREARVVGRAYSKELLKTLALDPLEVSSNSAALEKHAQQYEDSMCSRYEDPFGDLIEPECDIPVIYVAPERSQDAVCSLQDSTRFCGGVLRDYENRATQLHPDTYSRTDKYLPASPNEESLIDFGSNNGVHFDRPKESDDSSSWYDNLRILCGDTEVDSRYDQEELQQHREWWCYNTNDNSILQDQQLVPSRPAPPVPSLSVKTPPSRHKSSIWSRGHVAGLQNHHTRSPSDSHSPNTDTFSTVSPNTPLRSRFSPIYSIYSPNSSPAPRWKDSLPRQSPKSIDDVLDTVDEEALELFPDALPVRSRESSRVRRLVAKFEK